MVAVREAVPPMKSSGTLLVSGTEAVSVSARRLALFRSSGAAYYLFEAWFRNDGERTEAEDGVRAGGIPWSMQWAATGLMDACIGTVRLAVTTGLRAAETH